MQHAKACKGKYCYLEPLSRRLLHCRTVCLSCRRTLHLAEQESEALKVLRYLLATPYARCPAVNPSKENLETLTMQPLLTRNRLYPVKQGGNPKRRFKLKVAHPFFSQMEQVCRLFGEESSLSVRFKFRLCKFH